MSDLILTAMVTPSNQTTYCTIDGSPYRGDDSNIVHVKPAHIGELTALGFTAATGAQLPAGDAPTIDTGWAIAT